MDSWLDEREACHGVRSERLYLRVTDSEFESGARYVGKEDTGVILHERAGR